MLVKCSILCSASTKFTPFTASPRFSAQFRDAGTRERMGIHDRLQSLARKEFLRRRPALPRSHHGNGAAAAAFGAEGNGARFAKMKHGFESSLGRGKSTTGSPFPPVGALASVACRGQAPSFSIYACKGTTYTASCTCAHINSTFHRCFGDRNEWGYLFLCRPFA